MSPTRLARLASATALLALAACDVPMSALGRDGEGARRVTGIAWFLIVTAAIVYAATMAIMLLAIMRNRARDPHDVDLSRPGTGFIFWGGGVMPAVVLTAAFIVGLAAMGRFPASVTERTPHFTVIGHQWWWQVEYDDPHLPGHFSSANELHVPVGEPVRIRLISRDVIHSFWIPRLQGKIDLIPGDTNEVRILAEHAGVYRGQCVEYCGDQHAHMAFTVVAESPADYRAWIAAQQRPARAPADSLAALGQQLFLSGPCAMCHTLAGTPAQGQVAPDLTHVGSRHTLAAGTVPNTLGNMEGWIANAQSLKPGTRMPTITQYSGRELRAIATYLETLK